MGLIKADLARYGSCLDFNVTRGWINYLYKRMNMARRMVTTSRPQITRSIWEETRFIFLREIAHAVSWHDILDELIINVDQTPSKFVPTDNVTMAVRGTKHIPRIGANDKRGIAVTLSETLSQARRRGGQEGAGAPPAFQSGEQGSTSALFKCNDLFPNC